MARILTLQQRDDFLSSPTTELSLVGFEDGFELVESGWETESPVPGESRVRGTLTLLVRGSSKDALATAQQALNDMEAKTRWWFENPVQQRGVWLYAQEDGETNERIAFIYSLSHSPINHTSQFSNTAIGGYYYLPPITLTYERGAYWEQSTVPSTSVLSGINTIGGMAEYGTIYGDMPARLALVDLIGETVTQPLATVWMGFKSNRHSDRTLFQPTWSLRKSATFSADTTGGTTHADSDAKDGYRAQTTFASSAALIERARIRCQDVTSNFAPQRGTYLVLLRARVSASNTVVRVSLGEGLYGSSALSYKPRQVVTSTEYLYHEMGHIQIPSPGRVGPQIGSEIKDYALSIKAERVSGSGYLYMDTFVLVPTDEGWLKVDGGAVELTGGDTRNLWVTEKADGQRQAVWTKLSVPQSISKPNIVGGLPPGAGRLVLAAQGATKSVKADTISVQISYKQRWGNLRGAE